MDTLEIQADDKMLLENCRFGDIKCFELCPLFDQDENMCKFDIVGRMFGNVVEFMEKLTKGKNV